MRSVAEARSRVSPWPPRSTQCQLLLGHRRQSAMGADQDVKRPSQGCVGEIKCDGIMEPRALGGAPGAGSRRLGRARPSDEVIGRRSWTKCWFLHAGRERRCPRACGVDPRTGRWPNRPPRANGRSAPPSSTLTPPGERGDQGAFHIRFSSHGTAWHGLHGSGMRENGDGITCHIPERTTRRRGLAVVVGKRGDPVSRIQTYCPTQTAVNMKMHHQPLRDPP